MSIRDDVVEHGNGGVEMSFDDELSGRPGLARVYNDVRQNAYDSVVSRAPEPGTNLTLTHRSESAIRSRAGTGHGGGEEQRARPDRSWCSTLITATSSRWPTTRPTIPMVAQNGVKETVGARSNLAVATPFEPGSVFKVVTLAAALETTNLTPDSMINCGNGTINLFGRVIHDHNRYSLAQHGGRAGELEQHRRHPNRLESRREERSTNTCAFSASGARPGSNCRGNRRACCAA